MIRNLLAIACLAGTTFAAEPRGCAGMASLGAFRISVRPSAGAASLPLKSVSHIPPGAKLIWDPVRLSSRFESKGEVTALLVPAQGSVAALPPRKAAVRAEWDLPFSPTVIAIVVGPQGLSIGRVTSLVKRNEDLLAQLADYAEQSSEVETLVQQLADSEESGRGADAALKGFSAQYGVAIPKLDPKASSDQQASLLLRAVLPTFSSYDPLAPAAAQMQQSVGLAASVAGLFFGNGVALAAGGTAVVANLKTALFPATELRSAFAQSEKDGLALCTKNTAPKSRTRIAYLWAWRVPNLAPPITAIAGPANLPLGADSPISCAGPVKELSRARDWRLVPAAGPAIPVKVEPGASPNTMRLDLTDSPAAPGDYRLAASWDWDSITLGKVHLHPLADLRRIQIAPESRDRLVEGSGTVPVKLTGADFEFVEKVAISKTAAKPAASIPVEFELPSGSRAGVQKSMTADVDTAASGAYRLMLAQSGGKPYELPLTVLPPLPKISNLPLRVNVGDAAEPLRLEGVGLDRIVRVTSGAGEIEGKPSKGGWCGRINPAHSVRAGERFSLSIEVEGRTEPLTVSDAIEIVGPRPAITEVRHSTAANPGIDLQPGELPAGIAAGMVLAVKGLHDGARPRLELSCRAGNMRKSLALAPDESSGGATLSSAGAGELYLSLDPGLVGYAGCELAADITVEPEGRSDNVALGRVVRVPRLDQFTLTSEPLGPSVYAGILKGSGLDLVEKTGWDPDHGLPVDAIPAPLAGEPGKQTLRIALPWPAPAPHAPLYVWLRGEEKGRKTGVAD